MSNIQELLGLRPVVPKTFAKAIPLPNPDPQLLYGVELEIEKCYNYEDWNVSGIRVTDDGSLRDMGKEFITSPMTYSNLVHCLNNFFDKSKVTADNYSERCSVHVHANCLDLTLDQLQVLLLQYQVFERLLFDFVGGDRDKNIFCVPWNQTNLTFAQFANANDLTKYRRWQKYSALNLIPLTTQGTVEFRHMPGTNDREKLQQWFRIIGSMFAYARRTTLAQAKEAITSLNTNSQYLNILNTVFGLDVDIFARNPMYEQLLEAGVLDVKYMLLTSNTPAPRTFNYVFEAFDDVFREEQGVRAEAIARPLPAAPVNRWNDPIVNDAILRVRRFNDEQRRARLDNLRPQANVGGVE